MKYVGLSSFESSTTCSISDGKTLTLRTTTMSSLRGLTFRTVTGTPAKLGTSSPNGHLTRLTVIRSWSPRRGVSYDE